MFGKHPSGNTHSKCPTCCSADLNRLEHTVSSLFSLQKQEVSVRTRSRRLFDVVHNALQWLSTGFTIRLEQCARQVNR